MGYKFRGEDRLMMQNAIRVLNAIAHRDKLAMGTKKTAAISTRTLILDANPPGTGPLYTAYNTLLTQFINLLAQKT